MLAYRKIGKVNLVFGVDWRIAQDKADLKMILSEGEKPCASVTIKSDEHLLVGLAYEPVKVRSLCAAGVLAALFESAIALVPLDEGRYWLCVVQDSSPVPARDLVLDREAANRQYEECSAMFPAALLIGEGSSAALSADDLWVRVEESLADKSFKKRIRPYWIDRTKTTADHIKLVTALLLPVLAAGGLLYMKQLDAERRARELAMLMAMGQASQRLAPDAEKERAEKIRKAKEQIVTQAQQAHQALMDRLIKTPMPDWAFALSSVPPHILGYEAKKIYCTSSECTIDWRELKMRFAGSGIYTFAKDKHSLPGRLVPKSDFYAQTVIEIPTVRVDRQNEKWILDDASQEVANHARDEMIDTVNLLLSGFGDSKIGQAKPAIVTGNLELKIPDTIVGYTLDVDITLNEASPLHVSYLKALAENAPLSFSSMDATMIEISSLPKGRNGRGEGGVSVKATLIFPLNQNKIPKTVDDIKIND